MREETIRSRFAVMNNAYAAYSFPYFLDSLDRLGLRKIDLWGGIQHFDPHSATPRKLQNLKREIAAREMEIVAYTPELLAYPYNFASPEARTRRESVRYARLNVEIAAALGIGLMLISPGWGLLDIPFSQSWAWARDCISEIAIAAEALGVRLILEHLTPQSSNLLTNALALGRMLTQVNSRALGAVLDLGQMSVFGETVSDYERICKDRLWHVHIMDGAPEGHLAFGDGALPVEAYWRELNARGYAGCFTLEINDGRYRNCPHEALERCVNVLKRWSD